MNRRTLLKLLTPLAAGALLGGTVLWRKLHPEETSNTINLALVAQSASFGAGANLSYQQGVIKTFGAAVVRAWPFADQGGASITELVAGDHALPQNVTLGQPGHADGFSAVGFQDDAAAVNIYSEALSAAFPAAEGSLALWYLHDSAAIESADIHYLFRFYVDGANYLAANKGAGKLSVAVSYAAGGSTVNGTISNGNLLPGWNLLVTTWSKSADQFKVYLNGLEHISKTGLGTWAGVLSKSLTCIGSGGTSKSWGGDIDCVMLFNRALTPAEILALQKDAAACEHWFLTYGDSKTAANVYQAFLQNDLYDALGYQYLSTTNLGVSGSSAASRRPLVDAELLTVKDAPNRWILCNLGVNDIAARLPVETVFKDNYGYILDALHARFPHCSIGVARIWRRGFDDSCDALNAWIDELIAARSYCVPGPDERLVIRATGDGASYSSDGLHPNAAGYEQMANAWKTLMG